MSPVFLLLPVFLPILGGLGFFVLKFQRDSARNAYSEAVTVLTTALVWIAYDYSQQYSQETFSSAAGAAAGSASHRRAVIVALVVLMACVLVPVIPVSGSRTVVRL